MTVIPTNMTVAINANSNAIEIALIVGMVCATNANPDGCWIGTRNAKMFAGMEMRLMRSIVMMETILCLMAATSAITYAQKVVYCV